MRRWSRWSRLPVVQFAAGGVAMILFREEKKKAVEESSPLFLRISKRRWVGVDRGRTSSKHNSLFLLCFFVFEFELKAGGIVTDASGKALDFSKGKYLDLDTGIIVASEKIINASASESSS
uniref:Uncharacterized protein n=1 Tax=Brassica oleracea TaxID=3712 RepID=A0A3P6F3Q8_BRAOL|nr:unnamed protein product [Brassica oleracea]